MEPDAARIQLEAERAQSGTATGGLGAEPTTRLEKHPLKVGKAEADNRVERSLYEILESLNRLVHAALLSDLDRSPTENAHSNGARAFRESRPLSL
jgi:hypothetical protein